MKNLLLSIFLLFSFGTQAQLSIYNSSQFAGNPDSGFIPVSARSGNIVYIYKLPLSRIGKAYSDSLASVLQAALSTKQSAFATGNASQYFRGDLSLASFPTIPTDISQLSNSPGYITGSALAPYLTAAAASLNYFPLAGGTLTGTDGNGYLGLPPQSITPVAPLSGVRQFSTINNSWAWETPLGYVREFRVRGQTQSNIYHLQNKTYTIADSADIAAEAAARIAADAGKVDKTTGISINGVFQDLTQSRNWTVSGGTSAYTANRITFSNSIGLLTTSDSLTYDSTAKQLRIKVSKPPYSGNLYIESNSIGFGIGATSTATRFSTLVSKALRMTEVNNGVSGRTLHTYYLSRATLVPIKSGANSAVLFEHAINDINNLSASTYPATQFKSELIAVMQQFVINGFAYSDIVLCGVPLTSTSRVGGTAYARADSFNTYIKFVADSLGTKKADIYTSMINSGGLYLVSSDSLHPNDNGHEVIALTNLTALKNQTYTNSDQSFAVSGTTELNKLRLSGLPVLPQDSGYLVGVDSRGNLGILNALKNKIRANGDVAVNGALIIGNPLIPDTYTSGDVILTKGNAITSAVNTNTFKYRLVPIDNLGNTTYSNYYTTGKHYFYVSGGTTGGNVSAVEINADKSVLFQGQLNLASNGILRSQLSSTNGGQMQPFTTGGETVFNNTYTLGHYRFFVSGGTTGSSVEALDIKSSGNIVLQDGGTFADIPSSKFTVNSNTKGVLFPRMSTTARNSVAVGQIATINITTPGSGYTPGTYTNVPLNGGNGTGATASISITSGGLANFSTITLPGVNYKLGDNVSFSATSVGGTGSGAIATVTSISTNGLTVYDSTANTTSVYDGLRWTYGAKILKGSAILDFPSTIAGVAADLNISVTGAAFGDCVSIGVPENSMTPTGVYTARVSAANVVTIRYIPHNTEDPASGVFNVKVFKD